MGRSWALAGTLGLLLLLGGCGPASNGAPSDGGQGLRRSGSEPIAPSDRAGVNLAPVNSSASVPAPHTPDSSGQTAPPQAEPNDAEYQELDLATKAHDAAVVTLVAPDTSNASLAGRHTVSTALRYCRWYHAYLGWEDRLDPASLRACAADKLKQDAKKTYQAWADCRRRIITDTRGNTYRYDGQGRDETAGFPYDRWRDTTTGEELGRGSVNDYMSVLSQYRTLCPATSGFLVD